MSLFLREFNKICRGGDGGSGSGGANPGPNTGGPAANSPAGGAQAASGSAPGTGDAVSEGTAPGFDGPFSGRHNLSREQLSQELDDGTNPHPEVGTPGFDRAVDLSFQNSQNNPNAANAMSVAQGVVASFFGLPMTALNFAGKAVNSATGKGTSVTGIGVVDSAINGVIGNTISSVGAPDTTVSGPAVSGDVSQGVAGNVTPTQVAPGNSGVPASSGGLMKKSDTAYLDNSSGLAPLDRFTADWYKN